MYTATINPIGWYNVRVLDIYILCAFDSYKTTITTMRNASLVKEVFIILQENLLVIIDGTNKEDLLFTGERRFSHG